MPWTHSPDPVHLGPGAGTALEQSALPRYYASPDGIGWITLEEGGDEVIIVDSGPITTGPVTVAPGAPFTQLFPDQAITAKAGDKIGLKLECLLNSTGGTVFFDFATRVANADVNYATTGGPTSLMSGNSSRPGWYVTFDAGGTYPWVDNEIIYTVQAADVVSGQVTFRAYGCAESAAHAVVATPSFPARVTLINHGQG